MASETCISIAQKVHLAQIKLAPIYFPILSGSGPSRFQAQMQQPETLSDLINFVSFGHIFCQDQDLAILLHQDVPLAQTELYQMDLLDGIACATKAFGKPPGHCVRWARSISNRGAQPGRAKRGAVAERSEAFWPSEARRDPEPREGRQGKLEATQLPRLGCRELARGG